MSLSVSLFIGLVLSTLIGFVAYRRGSLTKSGVLGAILTGTLIFGFGGFVPGLALVAFFVSSAFLSKFRARSKQEVNEKFQKGSRRDFGQALANGGWATLMAVGIWYAETFAPDARGFLFFSYACIGAIAAVTADTWATEIGVLSKTMPRLITTGRIVPIGTSGGVTLLGTVTALFGAMFIGGVTLGGIMIKEFVPQPGMFDAAFALDLLAVSSRVVGIAAVSGLAGALFDSVLGATVQAIYFSEYDERQTEKNVDSQGNPIRRVRGVSWIDNDVVNLVSSAFGGLVAGGLALWTI